MRHYSNNRSFIYDSEGSRLFFLLMLCLLSAHLHSCGPKNWIKAKDNGCGVYDPEPVKGQELSWDGACVDGYADGYGVLSVFEKGNLAFTCEGNSNRGRFQGIIIFSVYKDKDRWCQYEEQWKNGKPLKRTRNITLETVLSGVPEAREYLYLLKKFKKEHPDVWIDDFHEILLKKTGFACQDIEESSSDSHKKTSENFAITADKGIVKKGKVFNGELLFKVYNHHLSSHVFYTVFHHRSASLKELVSDAYIPGGDQFFTMKGDAICQTDALPLALPNQYAPQSLSQMEKLVFLEMDSFKGKYWYPVKNE